MIRLMLAAPASGGGKTALTCALLCALSRRGLNPCAFKCGPDYIDPMFHRTVLGVESHNLDLFLSDERAVRRLAARYEQSHDAAVFEGVMGFYDGVGGMTDRASAWHLADTLHLPVLLVLRPKGASLTLAAQVQGMLSFRQPSHLVGILLSDCSPMLAKSLAPMLEQETGLPVLGCLPHMAEAQFESRHLGLYTAGEIGDLSERIGKMSDELEKNADLSRLISLCSGEEGPAIPSPVPADKTVRIAAARDEAFCFCYEETLDALRDAGAEIVFFSPLHDPSLPEHVGGLYLPGGYPELYAGALSDNAAMRESIRQAAENGLPTVAECGGFLYLGQQLEDETGQLLPMVGLLPGTGRRQQKLVRFGYSHLTAKEDSLLFEKGESVPVHEFHYWDSSHNGADFLARKPVTGRSWDCGFGGPTLYAAFPHLYFAGAPQLAERFVRAARNYQRSEKHDRA